MFRMCLAALAASTALACPAFADTLVDNVDGVTIDEKGGVLRFTGPRVRR